jgi:hypothetical protein
VIKEMADNAPALSTILLLYQNQEQKTHPSVGKFFGKPKEVNF